MVHTRGGLRERWACGAGVEEGRIHSTLVHARINLPLGKKGRTDDVRERLGHSRLVHIGPRLVYVGRARFVYITFRIDAGALIPTEDDCKGYR